MYDDEDEEDEEGELNTEAVRREGAEETRGKDERAFYDDLAKKEDERHNAMRADLRKRSLATGELRQKLRHKQADVDAIAMKIRIEQDRIDYEQKKIYRIHSGDTTSMSDEVPVLPIPILSKDIKTSSTDVSSEFSIERAQMHVKQLETEKEEAEKELKIKLDSLHEEERALSQLEHALMRM